MDVIGFGRMQHDAVADDRYDMAPKRPAPSGEARSCVCREGTKASKAARPDGAPRPDHAVGSSVSPISLNLFCTDLTVSSAAELFESTYQLEVRAPSCHAERAGALAA